LNTINERGERGKVRELAGPPSTTLEKRAEEEIGGTITVVRN
jgi:hypothetical protein